MNSVLPSHHPLPLLQPLPPPQKILKICRELKEHQQTLLKDQFANHTTRASEDFKEMYEQKCEKLIDEIRRCRDLERTVQDLREHNKELQI